MRIDVSLLPVLAATFMLVFARVGSMVMLLPGLGESNIPVRIKLAIALLLTLILLPLHRAAYQIDVQAINPLQQVRGAGVVDAAGEGDRRPGDLAQRAQGRAVADDHERAAQLVEGVDRDVDALVRHELGQDEVEVAALLGRDRREAGRLDGRVDDVRVAAP